MSTGGGILRKALVSTRFVISHVRLRRLPRPSDGHTTLRLRLSRCSALAPKIMDRVKNLMSGVVGGGATSSAATPSEAQYEKANEMLETSLTKCPRVKFLADIMEKMGCKMQPGFYSIVECEGQINGGFHLDDEAKPGVVLCQNHIPDQEWMDRTVAHELVHAYDQCRSKLDWTNCEHHACSEVRAAALSGDCDWKYEFQRKNFNIAKQHQICTRRRAKLSIQNNDNCKGKEDECLDKVFAKCYHDVSPFREIP